MVVYFLFHITLDSFFSNSLLCVLFTSLGVKQEDGKYKHTADLPKSTFAIRANSSLMEPEILHYIEIEI